MRAVESEWWILDLPDEWEAEQDDDAIVIQDRDGVGEIVITTLQKTQGDVTAVELSDYTRDVADALGGGEEVTLADASGWYFSFADGGEQVREWYLRRGDLLLLVTYCCDADNAGLDDAAVDDILSTLFFKVPSD